MIKLSEEGMVKAKIDQKVSLLCQTAQLWMNKKEKFLKVTRNASLVNTNDKKVKQPDADVQKVLVVCTLKNKVATTVS